jgi:hypothetical protein
MTENETGKLRVTNGIDEKFVTNLTGKSEWKQSTVRTRRNWEGIIKHIGYRHMWTGGNWFSITSSGGLMCRW